MAMLALGLLGASLLVGETVIVVLFFEWVIGKSW